MKELVIAFAGSCAAVALMFGHCEAIQWLSFHQHDIAAIALAFGPIIGMGTFLGYKAMKEGKSD